MKRAWLAFFLFLFPLTLTLGQTTLEAPYQEVVQQQVKVDKHASYPGGLQGLNLYVMRNIKYPREAMQQKITGKVFVKFTVGTDGEVSKVDILKSDHPLFAEEAQRLFKGMSKWMPAYLADNPVEVSYAYPLTFK
jgi:TonB family protein